MLIISTMSGTGGAGSHGIPGTTARGLEKSQLYSEELGIDLEMKTDDELFKWFLASVLMGARISENLAKRTYRSFESHDLLAPRRILKAGWDFLVYPVMREGGYVRYDEKTSREILRNCEMLLRQYGGSLNRLHEVSDGARGLERNLLEFYGVGPVTVNIFLRELRPYWEKADPEPLAAVVEAATRLGISLDRYDRKSITFARVEAGLVRLRKTLRPPRTGQPASADTKARRSTMAGKVNPIQLQKFLKDMDYPARKKDLIEHARRRGADADVLSTLERIPDQEYDGPTGIAREVGKIE